MNHFCQQYDNHLLKGTTHLEVLGLNGFSRSACFLLNLYTLNRVVLSENLVRDRPTQTLQAGHRI